MDAYADRFFKIRKYTYLYKTSAYYLRRKVSIDRLEKVKEDKIQHLIRDQHKYLLQL